MLAQVDLLWERRMTLTELADHIEQTHHGYLRQDKILDSLVPPEVPIPALAEIQVAHIGNNFTLTFQNPEQRDIQATFDIPTGTWGRSFQESLFIRPTDSVDVTTSYFLPASFGGDHAFKAGYRWRTARAHWRLGRLRLRS